MYLNDTSRDLEMLDNHPLVKSMFLNFNTSIPSSAPVERLCISAALILSKKRNKLSDKWFEQLTLAESQQVILTQAAYSNNYRLNQSV